MVGDVLGRRRQDVLISRWSARETRRPRCALWEGRSGRGRGLPLSDVGGARARGAGRCSFGHDPAKKGKDKGHREGRSNEAILQKGNTPERQGKKIVLEEKIKAKEKESDKEKVTVAMVKIANHRLRDMSGKLLTLETSTNTHFRAE